MNNIPNSKYGWFGNYSSWNEVNSLCKGYDDALIFDKVKQASLDVKNGLALFERDSVLFYEEEFDQDFLNILEILSKEKQELNILDFGGALGSLYFQYKSKFDKFKKISWNIVEQKHYVDFGKSNLENDNLRFHYTIEDCLKENKSINIILLSSVISYFEKPYDLLKKVIALKLDYILIDKTIFCNHDIDILTLQIVPPTIYDASYPCWILNENNLVNFLSVHYTIVHQYYPYGKTSIEISNKTAYFKAILFKIKQQ
jgi:putative methyltransferase (TIGR04325 family)